MDRGAQRDAVLSAIDRHRDFIDRECQPKIVRAHGTGVTHTIVLRGAHAMLVVQPHLPDDPINHPYKRKPRVFFMVVTDDTCYEGYLYLLQPNFHTSLLAALKGDAYAERIHWLDSKGKREGE